MNHDAELDELKAAVSCALLLEQYPPPWQLDKRESTRHCLKYRRGEGEIILVTHGGLGWWDPGSTAKGDVLSLVQHLEPGLNFGHVRKVLRPLAGLQPTFPEHLRDRSRSTPAVPIELRWARRGAPSRGSSTWRYLTEQRRLPDRVVAAAVRAGVLREGPYASAWFAHRDHGGRLTGYEMRGPDYRGFSSGGEKTLFRLPGRTEAGAPSVTRLVVAEAPIDALSVASLEHLRSDSLYTAVGGGMGPETIRALDIELRQLARIPDALLIAATDADRAGDNYAERLEAMAVSSRVRIERLRPEAKDWNEALKQGRGA